MSEIRTVIDDVPTVGGFLLCLADVSDNPRRLCTLRVGHRGTCLPMTTYPRRVEET